MKYKKYTSEGMNINDLVLTELGSMEGFIPFCLLNHHINVNGIIPPNTAYIVDTDLIVNVNNVSYLKSKNIQINTGDVQIPSPPSGLSVRQGGIGELILNWSDNSQSKYGFEVYRRRKGAVEFVRIAVTEVAVSNYTDSVLGHGITYEYQVKIADFAGAVEFSNIAEGTTISADLQFFASKPQNISHSGTGEWRHENGVSYLFATSGKDKVSLISACDAGVSGVVDLSSSEWSSLVYACFKKATKLDLRIGGWINQANVTVSVENAIVFKDDLKAFLSHVKTVNNSENWGNRMLYIGVITTDPNEDAQLIADVEELESLGWTIQIVYEELLSFTVSEKTFVDTSGRVSQNSGADLWTKNEAVFVGGYVEKGEVVKVYHSDVARVVDVNCDDINIFLMKPLVQLVDSDIYLSIRQHRMNTINLESFLYECSELANPERSFTIDIFTLQSLSIYNADYQEYIQKVLQKEVQGMKIVSVEGTFEEGDSREISNVYTEYAYEGGLGFFRSKHIINDIVLSSSKGVLHIIKDTDIYRLNTANSDIASIVAHSLTRITGGLNLDYIKTEGVLNLGNILLDNASFRAIYAQSITSAIFQKNSVIADVFSFYEAKNLQGVQDWSNVLIDVELLQFYGCSKLEGFSFAEGSRVTREINLSYCNIQGILNLENILLDNVLMHVINNHDLRGCVFAEDTTMRECSFFDCNLQGVQDWSNVTFLSGSSLQVMRNTNLSEIIVSNSSNIDNISYDQGNLLIRKQNGEVILEVRNGVIQ